MNRKNLAISAVCVFLLVGCGGNSRTGVGSAVEVPTIQTGVLVDSAVEGVSYLTATQSGITNSAGEFQFVFGEEVTFSIGAMQLPTVFAASLISPVSMGAASGDPAATTTNIARLLQSLDSDGNADNGITIAEQAAVSAASINFDVSVEAFENDPVVINLVANSGSVITSLISAEAANAHLDSTLNGTPAVDSSPQITGFSLTEGTTPVLTVSFSIDMTEEFKTEGEYVPARSFWQDLRTFVVEFESVQPDGSIRLIPEFFISVSGQPLEEGLEVFFAGNQASEREIVLDLRNSEWKVTHPPTACDGMSNNATLRYSQTRFSGESSEARIQPDGSCARILSTWDRAFDDQSGSEFMFLCDGDAQCTFDEINRTLVLAAGDPRNSCVDSNGISEPADRAISHVPGSNIIRYGHCSASVYMGDYIRQ